MCVDRKKGINKNNNAGSVKLAALFYVINLSPYRLCFLWRDVCMYGLKGVQVTHIFTTYSSFKKISLCVREMRYANYFCRHIFYMSCASVTPAI